MGTIAEKLSYLDETREQILTNINALGGDLTEEDTLRSYANALDEIWEEQDHITGTGTSLSLATKSGKMKVNLLGNTSQYTTTGKNLLETTNYENTGTKDGITFTNNGDGTITVNGKYTGSTYVLYYLSKPYWDYSDNLFSLPAGTYTFSCLNTAQHCQFLATIYDSGGTNHTIRINNTSSVTETFTETKKMNIRIFVEGTDTYNNLLLKPMIEVGSTATTWEPYTGGATPRPNYPQDVNVVSGDNTIVSTGKNLLDIQSIVKGRLDNGELNYASNTTNLTLNTNSFSFTTNNGYRGATSDYIQVKNGTYSFNSNALNSSYGCEIASYDEDKVWLGNVSQTALASETKRTFTISNNAKYIRIYFYLSSAGTITIENPQLEIGSTASTYEPYTSTSYQVNLPIISKNIFDIKKVIIGAYNTSNNKVTGINTANTTRANNYYNPLKVKPNATYTISFNSTYRIGYFEVDDDDNILVDSGWKTTTTTFTTNSNTKKIYFNLSLVSNTTIDLDTLKSQMKLQVEESATATPYEEFNTLELCEIPNTSYQDRFIRTTGKNLFDDTLELGNINQWGNANSTTGIRCVGYTAIQEQTKYTISSTSTINFTYMQMFYYNESKEYLSSEWLSSGTFTTPANAKYLRFKVNDNTNTTQLIQIELGNTATSYEPYGSGEWFLRKYIGKVVLDGSEDNWQTSSLVVSGYKSYYVTGLITTDNATDGYSNYFQRKLFEDWTGLLADNFFEFANNSMGFRIDETIANDLSAFKTWLGNHNTIIYYTAKTPTYTQITGTLKDELEAVWRANSYKGTTNISQVNNDLPFNLSVTALAGETE